MSIKSETIRMPRMPQRRNYRGRVVRNKKVPHNKTVTWEPLPLKNLLGIGLIVIFLGLAIVTSFKISNLAMEIKGLEQEYVVLQKRNLQLKHKYSMLTSRESLMAIGKKLGLRPPTQEQTIYLKP